MTSQPTQATNHQPYPVVSGKIVLLGTVIGCVVLFFLTWASLRSVEKRVHFDRTHLSWAERAEWTASQVIQTTLVKPNAANAQYTYNKPRYRDPGLVITPEEEQAILACAALAKNAEFNNDTRRQGVLQHAADISSDDISPHFYPQYLLGIWHQLNNDADAAAECFQKSITLAPKIIVIEYKTPSGKPVANLELGTIEIGCDRVVEEKTRLDQRLVLVFPDQTTDAAGRVYLPVYDTTYRPVTLPEPDGYKTAYSVSEGWFYIPTRLGLLNATLPQN